MIVDTITASQHIIIALNEVIKSDLRNTTDLKKNTYLIRIKTITVHRYLNLDFAATVIFTFVIKDASLKHCSKKQ